MPGLAVVKRLVPELGEEHVALLHRVLAGLCACELLPVLHLPLHAHLGPVGRAADRGPHADEAYAVPTLEVGRPPRADHLDHPAAATAFDGDPFVNVHVPIRRRRGVHEKKNSWALRYRYRSRTSSSRSRLSTSPRQRAIDSTGESVAKMMRSLPRVRK